MRQVEPSASIVSVQNDAGVALTPCTSSSSSSPSPRIGLAFPLCVPQANFLKEEGATAVANVLQTNKRIRFLNLSGNAIEDNGLKAIAESLNGR